MSKINNLDVLKRMGELNRDIRLAPLGNLIRAKATKVGTEITIGVAGNVCNGLALGQYVGGLILADKQDFEKTKAEMDADAKEKANV